MRTRDPGPGIQDPEPKTSILEPRTQDPSLRMYEFNKCTIRLKMQELRIVDFVFYVITFVLAYLMN